MNSEIKALMKKAKYVEALKILENDHSLQSKITKSVIYERTGEFKLSLDLANEVYNETKGEPKSILYLRSLVNRVYAFWRLELYDNAFNDIDAGLSLHEDPKDEFIRYISELYYVRGILYHLQNKFSLAENDFQRSLDLRIKYDNQSLISHALNALAIVYESIGDTQKSLKTLFQALAIKEKEGNHQDTARTLLNISSIYQSRGEYKESRPYIQRGLELVQKYGSKRDVAGFLINLSVILHVENELEAALFNVERSYKLYEMDNYVNGMTTCLSIMISFYLKSNDLKTANTKFILLENIYRKNKSPDIFILYQLAYAEIQKNKSRMRDKIQALDIYYQLKKSKIDANNKIKVLVNICELLLEELGFLGGDEIVCEIVNILDELESLSEKEHLVSQQIKNLVIRGELEYYLGNSEVSKNLLIKAQFIAIEKSYKKMAQFISEKFDSLFLNNFPKNPTDALSVTESLRYLRDDLNAVQYSSNNEEAVVLLISVDSGLLTFQEYFDPNFSIQAELTAAFIAAIITFSRELFGEKDYIVQRIEHNDYSIFTSQIHSIQISYIFKGNSFSAMSNFIKLMNFITDNHEIYSNLEDSNFELPDDIEYILRKKVLNIFV